MIGKIKTLVDGRRYAPLIEHSIARIKYSRGQKMSLGRMPYSSCAFYSLPAPNQQYFSEFFSSRDARKEKEESGFAYAVGAGLFVYGLIGLFSSSVSRDLCGLTPRGPLIIKYLFDISLWINRTVPTIPIPFAYIHISKVGCLV